MNKLYYKIFFIMLLTVNISGCSYYFNSKSATERRIDIIIAETYNKYQDREMVFENLTADFPEYNEEIIDLVSIKEKETLETQKDGSQLNTLFDGYGNKTQIRTFFDDGLVKFVIVKTFSDGGQQALVFAQNGEIKVVPDELINKFLTLSGKEIAKIVGIIEGRKENEFLANLREKQMENNTEIEVKIDTITEKLSQTQKHEGKDIAEKEKLVNQQENR